MGITTSAIVAATVAAAQAAGTAAAGAAATVGIGSTAAATADAGFMAAEAAGVAGELGTAAATSGISATTLATLGATVLSGGVGTYGAIKSADAASTAAKYNFQVEGQNAAISKTNAQIAEQSGEVQAGIQGQRTKMAVGQSLASTGASGVSVDSGSAVSVRDSMRSLGEIDSLTIRSNAAREAYGYNVKSKSEEGQSALSAFKAANDTTGGKISAASTMLGSFGTASSEYQKYQLSSGNTL